MPGIEGDEGRGRLKPPEPSTGFDPGNIRNGKTQLATEFRPPTCNPQGANRKGIF